MSLIILMHTPNIKFNQNSIGFIRDETYGMINGHDPVTIYIMHFVPRMYNKRCKE